MKLITTILFFLSFSGNAQTLQSWGANSTTWIATVRYADSSATLTSYNKYVTRYYCARCPYKWIAFTDVFRGSYDNENWKVLDSAYIKKYGLDRIKTK